MAARFRAALLLLRPVPRLRPRGRAGTLWVARGVGGQVFVAGVVDGRETTKANRRTSGLSISILCGCPIARGFCSMGGRPQESGGPGPSHLGTWETTKANRRPSGLSISILCGCPIARVFCSMGGRPQKSGGPGPSHLGTWETTKANRRPSGLSISILCGCPIARVFARWAGDHKSQPSALGPFHLNIPCRAF